MSVFARLDGDQSKMLYRPMMCAVSSINQCSTPPGYVIWLSGYVWRLPWWGWFASLASRGTARRRRRSPLRG